MIALVYIAFVSLLLVMHRSVRLHVSGVGSGACNSFKTNLGCDAPVTCTCAAFPDTQVFD